MPHKTIGYVDVLKVGAYQKRVHDTFNAAIAPTGWTVKYVDAKGNPQAAAQAVQTMVDQHVDAIVDSAVDPELIRPQILAAKKASIPIITIAGQNRPNKQLDSMLAGEYGENEAALAQPLADKIAQDLPRGSKVAILKTSLFFAAVPRAATLVKVLQAHGIDVVANVETSFDVNESRKKAADILTAQPDLTAIIPVFDTWMASTVDAVKQAGKANKVKIYGFYADLINNPLMRANKNIVALTDGNQAEGAAIAVDQILQYLVKKRPIEHSPAAANFHYAAITPDQLPPVGQDGPVSVSDIVKPYIERWQKEFPR